MTDSPISCGRSPIESSRDRRIGLRFRDVAGLAQRLDRELGQGRLTVPDRRPSQPGERVMVSISLPGCQRLVEAPARVESVIDRGPEALGAMVLRLSGPAARLPALLKRFVRECRGELCAEAARNGRPAPQCLMALPGGLGSSGTNGSGSQKAGNGSQKAAEIGEPTAPVLSMPSDESMSARRGRRPSGVFARQDRKATTPPGGTRLTGMNRDKSSVLVEKACRTLQAKGKQRAQRMLRMALAIDPGNHKARALLKYIDSAEA